MVEESEESKSLAEMESSVSQSPSSEKRQAAFGQENTEIPENERRYAGTAPYRFTGEVTDLNGKPIAGVTVRFSGFGDRRVTDENSTKTRPDGSYDLWLNENDYEDLKAHGDGWAPKTISRLQPGPASQPEVVNFQLELGKTMGGLIVDFQGEPVADAKITAINSDQMHHMVGLPGQESGVRSETDGRFQLKNLPAGEIRLRAIAEGLSSYTDTVFVRDWIEIKLEDAAIIHARLIDKETGEPVYPLETNLIGYSEQPKPIIEDNEFFYTGLDREHKYSIRVGAEGYLPHTIAHTSPWGANAQDPILVEMSKGEEITVEFIDADSGDPIAGAHVLSGRLRSPNHVIIWQHLQPDWFPSHRVNTCSVCDVKTGVTDHDGVFRFQENPQTPELFAIWTPGYERFAIRPQDREEFRIEDRRYLVPVRKGAVVRGRLVKDGVPQAGVKMDLSLSDFDISGTHHYGGFQTSASGEFRWESLPPARMQLGIQRTEANTTFSWYSKTIELSPGDDYVVEISQDLGNISIFGSLEDEEKPVNTVHTVSLTPVEDRNVHFSALVDGLGRFHFSDIRPGEYEFRAVELDGHEIHREIKKTVNLKEGSRLDLSFQDAQNKMKTVTAELIFPPSSDHGGWKPDQVHVQLGQMVGSVVHLGFNPKPASLENGKLELLTEFIGDVRVMAGNEKIGSYILPGAYTIDPDATSTDLGQIVLPELLPLKVRLIVEEGMEAPEQLVMMATRIANPPEMTGMAMLPAADGQFHEIRSFPGGEYAIGIWNQKGNITPGSQQFTLAPAQPAPELTFRVRDVIHVFGAIIDTRTTDAIPAEKLKKITLISEQHNLSREITLEHSIEATQFAAAPGDFYVKDFAMFRFTELPAGPAVIEVQADGFETANLEVEMGDPEHHAGNLYQFELKPIAE